MLGTEIDGKNWAVAHTDPLNEQEPVHVCPKVDWKDRYGGKLPPPGYTKQHLPSKRTESNMAAVIRGEQERDKIVVTHAI